MENLHAFGIVHLDLAHRGNILVTADMEPVLIDFQSACCVERFPRALRWLLVRMDQLMVLKWKEKYFPQYLTVEERVACRHRRIITKLWPFG